MPARRRVTPDLSDAEDVLPKDNSEAQSVTPRSAPQRSAKLKAIQDRGKNSAHDIHTNHLPLRTVWQGAATLGRQKPAETETSTPARPPHETSRSKGPKGIA